MGAEIALPYPQVALGMQVQDHLDPPFGRAATYTGSKFDQPPEGVYPGLVGKVPSADKWTSPQLKGWRRAGRCLVDFPGRGVREIKKSNLKFSQ